MTLSNSELFNVAPDWSNVELGLYQSPEFPLLGVMTAICLSNAERERFWESPPPANADDPFDDSAPRYFCDVRYRLAGLQFGETTYTDLLLAPAGNEPFVRPCHPTDPQIDVLVTALRNELAARGPALPRDPPPPPFDVELAARYPVVASVYRYFVTGGPALATTWADDLSEELKERNNEGENIW